MLHNFGVVARPAGVYVSNPRKGLVWRTCRFPATQFQASCEHLANPIGPEADGNPLPALTTTEHARFDMADLLTTRQDESIQARFWDRVDVRGPDECWEWQGYRDRYGYGQVRTVSGVKAASRVALLLVSNLQRSDLHALHSCDNPPCCNPNHLRWGTPAENSADKLRRGRQRNKAFGGFNNPNCKIAPEALPEIVRLIDEGTLTNGAIGARFGVTHAMISKIRTGNAWQSQVEAIRAALITHAPEAAI